MTVKRGSPKTQVRLYRPVGNQYILYNVYILYGIVTHVHVAIRILYKYCAPRPGMVHCNCHVAK